MSKQAREKSRLDLERDARQMELELLESQKQTHATARAGQRISHDEHRGAVRPADDDDDDGDGDEPPPPAPRRSSTVVVGTSTPVAAKLSSSAISLPPVCFFRR